MSAPLKDPDHAGSNTMINFYTVPDVKRKLTEYWNPHFEQTQMRVPFRAVVVGSSSAGKTTFLANYLAKAQDTFGFVTVVCKMPSEPLYEYLEKKIGPKHIKFITKLGDLPPIEQFNQ